MRDKLEALAALIADYRRGEVEAPDADHVERWVRQFEPDEQVPLLEELLRLWPLLYVKQQTVEQHLRGLITDPSLAGADPHSFWARANVLDIQQRGSSQRAMRDLLRAQLAEAVGIQLDASGGGNCFIYLDDVLFTGDRVERDLLAWLPAAPSVARVEILLFAAHAFGRYQLEEKLKGLGQSVGKAITFTVRPKHELENRRTYRDVSHVLWPISAPAGAERYLTGATGFVPRSPGPTSNVFPSEPRRHLVEQALLKAGLKIVGLSRDPAPMVRPLGYGPFGLGFGSLILTYRNCPNNAPLALWWGDPMKPSSHPLSKWYPLVPRRTYGGDNDS
jgi:hypothetical protein